jgi:hypothetical protein
MDFGQLITDIVEGNSEINWSLIIILIGLYFISLWLVISIWVYYDAHKRYEGYVTPVLFGFLVFFLNFPMLIFYFTVRPDLTFEEFDDWEAGGVNVPIVNFMGKDGIEMSFEMRINPRRLRDEEKPDMNIEIGWDNDNEKFRLIDKDEIVKKVIEKDDDKKGGESKGYGFKKHKQKIVNFFDKVAGHVTKRVTEIGSNIESKDKSVDEQTDKDKDEDKPKEDSSKNDSKSDNKNKENLDDKSKSKNKKKDRKKNKKNN